MNGIFCDSWVVEHSRNHKPSDSKEHMRIILTCNIMQHFNWFGIDPTTLVFMHY